MLTLLAIWPVSGQSITDQDEWVMEMGPLTQPMSGPGPY